MSTNNDSVSDFDKRSNLSSQLYPKRSVQGNDSNLGQSSNSGNSSSQNNFDYFSQHKSHKKVIVLVIIILIVFSYLAFLYTKNFGYFGKPPFSRDNIMNGLLAGLNMIESADYKINLTVNTESKPSNTDPFIVRAPANNTSYKSSLMFSLLNAASSINNLPDDFMLDVNISGSIKKVMEHFRSEQMKVVAVASLDGKRINVDTIFNKISDDDYVVTNKLITLSDNNADIKSGSYFGSFLDQSNINQIAVDNAKQIKTILLMASKYNLFESNKEPVKEYINWSTFYKYELDLNKDNFIEFYSNLLAEFNKQNPGVNSLLIDQSTLDYLKSTEFNQAFENLKRNSKFIVWVNSHGTPVRMQYDLKFSPLKMSSQIGFGLAISLTNINKPAISIPEQTLSFDGQSKEQYQFDQQLNSISTIRKSLANYKVVKGSYPTNLEELTNAKDVTEYAYALGAIPKDVYSGAQFVYESNGQDYTLKYNITLPPYTRGDSVRRIFTFDYSSGSLMVISRAVQGENTANSKHQSEEAFTQSKKDTDGDKLPDIIETYIGSGIGSKDTDADGRSDYTEVMNGSNPLGSGNLKSGGSYWF